MSGNFEIGVQAETGNSQVVYNNNYQAQNEFYLTEAALNFQVTDDVLLRGGAFAQGKYENPLLFGPTISFPGVQQAVSFYRDSSGFFSASSRGSHPEFSNDDTGPDSRTGNAVVSHDGPDFEIRTACHGSLQWFRPRPLCSELKSALEGWVELSLKRGDGLPALRDLEVMA